MPSGVLSSELRPPVPPTLSERATLEAWLEFHRATLALKCAGLSPEQLRARPVSTSVMSLHGLVRHMAEVERIWFTRVLQRQADAEPLWSRASGDDRDFIPLDGADWEQDRAVWERQCEDSRRSASRYELDEMGERRGQPYSLRWIYNHMVEEYARHNGHADLIREMVDGVVGC